MNGSLYIARFLIFYFHFIWKSKTPTTASICFLILICFPLALHPPFEHKGCNMTENSGWALKGRISLHSASDVCKYAEFYKLKFYLIPSSTSLFGLVGLAPGLTDWLGLTYWLIPNEFSCSLACLHASRTECEQLGKFSGKIHLSFSFEGYLIINSWTEMSFSEFSLMMGTDYWFGYLMLDIGWEVVCLGRIWYAKLNRMENYLKLEKLQKAFVIFPCFVCDEIFRHWSKVVC